MSRGRTALIVAAAAALAAGLAVLGLVLWRPEPELGPIPVAPAPGREPAGEAPLAAAPEEVELHPGRPVEREMGPEETHAFRVSLQEGDFLHLVVEQQGIDVVVELIDPEDETVARVDEPIDELGSERLLALAATPGAHRVEIRSWPADSAGAYRAEVRALRPASEEDRRRAEAAVVYRAGDELRRSGRRRDSLERYREAERGFHALNDIEGRAAAYQRLCDGRSWLKEWRDAVPACAAAAELFGLTGQGRREALALKDLGLARFHRGEPRRAVETYSRALRGAEEAGDALLAVEILDLRAQSYQVLDEVQHALDDYLRVLVAGTRRRDPGDRGFTLHNLAVLYRLLGRPELARDLLEDAAATWSETGEDRQLAGTLNQLGQLAQDRGDVHEAAALYDRALQLRRAAGDRRGQAKTLEKLGRLRLELGEPEKARDLLQEALRILEGIDDPRRRGSLLLALGELEGRAGRFSKSLASYRQGLELYRSVGDLTEVAESLLGVARAERGLGQPEAALTAAREALELVESVRMRSLRQDLRTSFFATVDDHFEITIDLLMDLHRVRPREGHAAQALEVAERARARSLLDGLVEAGAEIRRGADPDLLGRERELQDELNAVLLRRSRLIELAEAASSLPAEAVAAAERQVRELLTSLEEVRAELRARSPRYAALTQPRPARLTTIQTELLDRETLLLEYRLGRERSFLWLVSRESLVVAELTKREEIEAAVRRAHDLLQQSHRREARAALDDTLCHLGRILLGPVADRLGDRRLVIVPDGALAYLSFAPLPVPSGPRHTDGCRQDRLMIAEHEITYLPSASALVTLRRRRGSRPPAEGLLAVVADPVFGPEDRRLRPDRRPVPASSGGSPGPAGPSEAEERRRAPDSNRTLARLRFARREAEAILELAPAGGRFSAFDFDASKETVTGGRLRGYRMVHLVTHGLLDTERPELSALVLSLVDEQGRGRDGYLRAHEIYNLDLPAELVVLSACETALGQEIRGEGLVGLTHGLFFAGAERVAVSLWRVSDRSTSELMERFYRSLLRDGLAPAAALRSAQLSMLGDPGRAPPYRWAGFVLQGEWR